MWKGIDSQEVGLEAATLKRKRNSSLVESVCAEDLTGLSSKPKLGVCIFDVRGRGAFRRPAKVD